MRNAKKLLALVLAFVMVLGVLPTASAQTIHTHGIEEYPEIQLNVETLVSIDEPGKTVYFRFTPAVTAEYTFKSVDAHDKDPQGYLYDADMNLLASHFDNGSIDFNFTLTAKLEAGVTYIWATNLYNAFFVRDFNVILTADLTAEHNYVGEVTTEPTCTTDGVMTYICTDCGDTYTEVIPGGHDFVDGFCTRCGEESSISGVCGEDLTWKLTGSGVLTISGTGDMYDYYLYFDPMIPWNDHLTEIKSVVVEEGVTSVGNFAFMNATSLTSVTLPDSLTLIGESAFRNCGSLNELSLGENITTIRGFAFMNCYQLPGLDLGDKVESIGNSAFFSCYALDSIDLGESLVTLDTLALSCCTSLTEIVIPDSVENMGSDVFSGCTALKTAKLSNSLTDLPEYTFNECSSLEEVILPEYLTTIGVRSFYLCTSLESIDLPFSMIAIDDDAFGFCTSLSDIQFPMALGYVGYFAFNGCTSLTNMEFPPNLTYFNGGMFYDCTGLTEIVFPVGTFYVDDDAFAGCTNVKKIVFTGDMPSILNAFIGITADAWYPAGNETWTEDMLLDYGGELTWHAMCENHSFGKWTPVVDATCTESGIDERVCSVCAWTEERVSEPTGHIWDEGVVQEDKTLYTCLICGVTMLDDHVHSYEAVVTEPTCTEAGYTTYTCECGDSYVAEEVPALGHTEEVIPAVAPTCTETGLTEGKKCSACGEILVAQEVVEALGHDWKGTGCTRCDATRENPFTDVPEDSFYIDPVLWAVEKGITNGTSETTFDPDGDCMRAAVVTFLWRAAGEPEPTITENPFTDVEETDFFYKAVLWAVEKGITNGTSASEFSPYKECNRAQVVTFLYRAMEKPTFSATESGFTDVTDPDEFYYDAVLWAVENNITNGMGDGTFGISKTCNRAQVVTFLHRAYVG